MHTHARMDGQALRSLQQDGDPKLNLPHWCTHIQAHRGEPLVLPQFTSSIRYGMLKDICDKFGMFTHCTLLHPTAPYCPIMHHTAFLNVGCLAYACAYWHDTRGFGVVAMASKQYSLER